MFVLQLSVIYEIKQKSNVYKLYFDCLLIENEVPQKMTDQGP